MRYIGGKSKIAKQIAETILSHTSEREHYLEPFIGGGAVFAKMAPHFQRPVAGDLHPDIALMWDAVFNDGWLPPESLTQDEWESLRHAEPSPLRAFAGFGCSFGGKWFRGYARSLDSKGNPRNHSAESYRAVVKIALSINKPVRVRVRDYRDWIPTPGTVIYCDPPYFGSHGYSTGNFDSTEFWMIAESWALDGCDVFVSEYQAPDYWEEIWSKEKIVELKWSQNEGEKPVRVERLFHLPRNG